MGRGRLPIPRTRIGSIVIDCYDFEGMLSFWSEALRYVPRSPPKEGWVVLADPSGKGPNVSLNKVWKRLKGRNWIHLDLYSQDQEADLKRLVGLGAKRHRQRYGQEDDFRVLEDPDGNLFCVVDAAGR